MPDAFTIEFDFRGQRFSDAEAGLRAFYETLNADWENSAQALSREMKSFLDQVVQAIAQRNGQSWPGGTTDSSLSPARRGWRSSPPMAPSSWILKASTRVSRPASFSSAFCREPCLRTARLYSDPKRLRRALVLRFSR